jgi:hypothetical protein
MLEFNVAGGMLLRDAIAYEFYMENVNLIVKDYEAVQLNKALQVLAVSSYLIADIFIAAGDHTLIQNTNESSTQES